MSERRRRRRQIYSGANAVNEEDSERERYPGVEDEFKIAVLRRRRRKVYSKQTQWTRL